MSEIINLRGAAKGTGSTLLLGARRARLIGGPAIKRAQATGGGIPAGAWKTGVASQVIIEVEGLAEPLNAIKGLLASQVLVLHYVAASGNRKMTVQAATATAVGESRFPPREGSANTQLSQITFDVHGDGVIEDPTDAIVDTTDSGSPPTETGLAPLVNLVSASRGAAGATAISSAVDAVLRCTMSKTVGRMNEYGLPVGVWVTAAKPQAVVNVEDAEDWVASVTAAVIDETIILVFAAGSANSTLTCKWGRLVDMQELPFKPPEESGAPGRFQLTWDLVAGTGVAAIGSMLALT